MEDANDVNSLGDAKKHARPLISLVIPVYDLQDYLRPCLKSIMQQQFKHFEIVSVDGQSTDASVKILREFSREDSRLKVICAERIGPGRARNLGAENATGEYIWFVDGDDLILPGCLEVIADRLMATCPDVLFLDHDELNPDGEVGPGPSRSLMARTTETCFTVAQQPWVTEFSMASWNKVIRREFFLDRKFHFLPDWPHEDVPVSCLLMLDAVKLSILNRICYRYTMDRPESAMREQGKRHFQILRSYEIVLTEIEERIKHGDAAVTAEVHLAFFQRALWHCTTIFDTGRPDTSPLAAGGFIAAADRREFFAQMHAFFCRYAPPGYRHPSGFRGIKFRLIKANDYRAYSLLDPANKLRVKASNNAVVGRRKLQEASGRLRRRGASLGGNA